MNPLGGPGVACSAMRVRRLRAGELSGEERARTEVHVAGCRRCRETEREIDEERVRLSADLPFETFAAGVAERLAPAPARRRPLRAVGLALAAGLAVAAAIPAVLRVAEERSSLAEERSSVRPKGGAAMTLYVRDAPGGRALPDGAPVPARASLRVGLSPGAHRYAAVVLVDRDGAAVLHAGSAPRGLLPGAFEWTGADEGALVAVLDDVPVDAAALADRVARGGPAAASPGGSAEVLLRPLWRSPP